MLERFKTVHIGVSTLKAAPGVNRNFTTMNLSKLCAKTPSCLPTHSSIVWDTVNAALEAYISFSFHSKINSFRHNKKNNHAICNWISNLDLQWHK